VGAGASFFNGPVNISGTLTTAGAFSPSALSGGINLMILDTAFFTNPASIITSGTIASKGITNTGTTISSSAGLTVGVGATILNGALSVSGTTTAKGITNTGTTISSSAGLTVGIGSTILNGALAVSGATVVRGNITPTANGTLNLGSAALRWANVYTSDLHLANERGDWTVIEEPEFLTIRNNKSGKRYKLLMQEVDMGTLDINGNI